jgi:hypothetical protein
MLQCWRSHRMMSGRLCLRAAVEPARAISLAALAISLSSCTTAHFDRALVIDPVNALLHRDYRDAILAMDPELIASFYVAEARPQAMLEAKRLVAAFNDVSNVECIIEFASHDEAEGETTAKVELRVDGITTVGERRTLNQSWNVVCARRDGDWRIVSREIVAENHRDAPGPRFADEAVERGLVFNPSSLGLLDRLGETQKYLPGSGLAVRDVNGDGLEDVLLVGGRALRLFLNDDGRFRDETDERGIRVPARGECRFGIFGDVDNDGHADLFVGVVNGPNAFFRGTSSGFFQVVDAETIGIQSSGETTSACFADFDSDGDLDLFIANGGNLLHSYPDPIYNARNGAADQLFLNRGDGTFADATERAGVGYTGWALACVTADFDADGDVDLFVGNDFGPDRLYENDGKAIFREVSGDAGIVHRGSTMGATFGDLDGDGDIDLFATGMASNSSWMIDWHGFPAPAPWPINVLFRSHVLDIMKEMLYGNRLYLNRGDGTFDEVSAESGVRNAGWGWGGVCLDYDNDARLDLYVVNGLWSGQVKDDL